MEEEKNNVEIADEDLSKTFSKKNAKATRVPSRYKINASSEEGFGLQNCMENFKVNPEDAYEKDSDYYFDSYAHFGIHEEMLKDKSRTLGYMNSIKKNPDLIRDKVVLDIGCGTGVLSIFAAQTGAKHVYAIECAGIANHAIKIVKDNGYADKITVIKSKVEEVTLPVDKVDVIISEWMGYFLLYESMFDSVIYARDKWLAPGGVMMPDRAVLYVSAIEDEQYKEDKIGFWDDVYGINMKSIQDWALLEPIIDVVEKQLVNTDACAILDIDAKDVKVDELEFTSEYKLTAKRNDRIHALVAWFDVFFSKGKTPFKISTSPLTKDTHWKQTVFYLKDVITVRKGDVVYGSIAVKKCRENPREIEVKLSYHVTNDSHDLHKTQFYRIT